MYLVVVRRIQGWADNIDGCRSIALTVTIQPDQQGRKKKVFGRNREQHDWIISTMAIAR